MSGIDIFIGICLAIGLFKGVRNGFFVELASLVSMLLGIWIAIKFSHLTQSWLESNGFEGHRWISTIAFAATFLTVIIGVSLLAKIFTSIADFASLGLINTIGGGLFGLLKTLLMLSIILSLLQKINVDHVLVSKKTLDDSLLYTPTQKISAWIYPAITEWFVVWKTETFPSDE